jgi:hypothetical protein
MIKNKSLKAIAIASGKKINKEIYFSKIKRKKWKSTFLESQKKILETEDSSVKPVLKEEYDRRTLATSILSFTVSGLETIKKAVEYDKRIYLTNCKFILYKKGNSLVFKANFLKPLLDKKKKRTSYLHFPQGFPKTFKKKAYMHKDGQKFSLKGYREIDSGTFRQKVLDYKDVSLKYKGKKEMYNFKLTLISDKKQSYWVTKSFSVKRS